MRRCIAICSDITLCLFFSLGTASAVPNPNPGHPAWLTGKQGRGNGNHGRSEMHKEHGRGHKKERVRVAFSVHEREMIRNYFHDYPADLPPGLAKRGGNLPPGLEKHLQKGGTLPPGLQKRLRPCPVRLSRRLPTLPSGYSRKMLGTQMLILDSMNVIRDIMVLSR